jgi:anthranilate phosphoribosyltransferase
VRQDGVSAELLEVLLDESMEGNRRWQALSRRLLASTLTGSDVYELFQAILHYDETFAASVERPVSVPSDAVVVSGSGKEMFKTFNVSTAAAIVAAAAGTPVIKGASRSVSATSGALDVLRQLGICVAERPGDIGASLKRHGIAFVDYRTFCPRYFDRYDGVSAELQPTSLLMPVAALCIRAPAFVHGLAAPLSATAAEAIALACPHLKRGVVVGAEPAPGRTIDEFSHHGRSWRSTLQGGRIVTRHYEANAAPAQWFVRVAQRASHRDNAELLWTVLSGLDTGEAHELVYDNAALVIEMGHMVPYSEARRRAQDAHTSGRAGQLLGQLATRRPDGSEGGAR